MPEYYIIPDHLINDCTPFERFQMVRFKNCLVLQDGHEPAYSEQDDPIEAERVEKEEVRHGY